MSVILLYVFLQLDFRVRGAHASLRIQPDARNVSMDLLPHAVNFFEKYKQKFFDF
jgi:hypothetical protein